jgi:hypothetical protein
MHRWRGVRIGGLADRFGGSRPVIFVGMTRQFRR